MAESKPSRYTEFLKAFLFLLILPGMPLLLEFICTISANSSADRFLERTSVVITASLLAAGVGVASKWRPVFGSCLVVAVVLAVMYGAVQARSHGAETKAGEKQILASQKGNDGVSETEPSTAALAPHATFWDRLDMDDLPGKVSWGVMFATSVILIVERAIRHVVYREPYRFEWSK